LISLEVRPPLPAQTRLPECREQKAEDEWSSMMKAMVYYRNGGPEVFQWTDVDVPACGPGQVVINNEHISIEGGDLIAREVMPPERVPHIVGYQCAGEILEVGVDVWDRWVARRS
jgi:NADPH2:quinone reductase